MDPYDGDILGNRFDPKWDAVRRNQGYTLRYSKRMDLAHARPAGDLASTKYCLAHPGRHYLVYKPGQGGSVTVELEPGTYTYEWFDPAAGKQVEAGTKTATGGATQFVCPIKADGMLFVTRTVFPAQDWQQTTPESQGLDSARLQVAADYLRENAGPDGVNELMIVRHGYLVWQGSKIDKVHGVWSATKSFTSTVLGLLVDDGKATLDTRAKDFVPALAASCPEVTLRHFTTMTSGYRAKQDEPRGTYRHGPSPTPFDPCSTPLFCRARSTPIGIQR